MNNLRAELLGKAEPAAGGPAAGEPAGDLAGQPDPIESILAYMDELSARPNLSPEDAARVQAVAAKAALVLARTAHPSGTSLNGQQTATAMDELPGLWPAAGSQQAHSTTI